MFNVSAGPVKIHVRNYAVLCLLRDFSYERFRIKIVCRRNYKLYVWRNIQINFVQFSYSSAFFRNLRNYTVIMVLNEEICSLELINLAIRAYFQWKIEVRRECTDSKKICILFSTKIIFKHKIHKLITFKISRLTQYATMTCFQFMARS